MYSHQKLISSHIPKLFSNRIRKICQLNRLKSLFVLVLFSLSALTYYTTLLTLYVHHKLIDQFIEEECVAHLFLQITVYFNVNFIFSFICFTSIICMSILFRSKLGEHLIKTNWQTFEMYYID